jgi:hypothetical protein
MRKISTTLIASLVVHAAPLALAWSSPVATLCAVSPPAADPPDPWAGTTAELGGEQMVDVSVDPPGAGLNDVLKDIPAPSGPLPDALPTDPAPEPVAPPLPEPSPTHGDDAARDPAPEKVAPLPEKQPRRSAAASAPEQPPHRPSGDKTRHDGEGDTTDSRGGGASDGASGGTFGAEGPGAPRDLGRAFTRAIPPACQADPIWSKLAPGDAGKLEITITIDETGHITGYKPAKGDAPQQLLAVVKRTIALLDAGTFALRSGVVSAGNEVLRIRAVVSDVDESEMGGAAGLAFSYERGKGEARFTQPGGRQVEVSVAVVRVEPGGASP